ncbi:TPA: hypothetical protein QCP61_005761 [Bacillus cereus]|uniref:hypothetical protein n=1 Tax=Bacillus paranthracis TaxID=2026186 RepID=UPI002A7EB1DA|nr:hypothetical protein [Bacillus paranthracis]MDY4270463.1 hypothetical protein [Bacillus paranthracis]MDY4276165.1 hypothetical protein [Bacillus paranthracis]MDY4293370.1 hypothetical protein [Bacillus paranthracis]HDR4393591.1 hypothetical protein [Bacillus cereus]
MKEKKPEQYGWKLKKVNDPDFWAWYEKQDNIGESLITLAQFFIKQYGVLDVKSFEAQQAMHRDLLLKDEFYQEFNQMKALLHGNAAMTVPNMPVEKPSVEKVATSEKPSVEKKNVSEQKIETEVKQEKSKGSLFGAVDQNSIL